MMELLAQSQRPGAAEVGFTPKRVGPRSLMRRCLLRFHFGQGEGLVPGPSVLC